MMYDNYVKKIAKLAKIKNMIYKLRFVIIGLISLIIILVTTLLINKGKVSEFEINEEFSYGDIINVKSDSFMSDINYQFKSLNSNEWIDGLPKNAGNYEIRLVTNGAFGEKYSESKIITINKKDLRINILSNEILYGTYPKLYAEGLLNNDKITNEIYSYDNLSTNNTKVNLDLISLKIEDLNGNDVTNNYNIIGESNYDINFNKLHTSITNNKISKIYDGKPIEIGRNIYSVLNLGYDDKLVWDYTYDIYDNNYSLVNDPINAGIYYLSPKNFNILNNNVSTLNNYDIDFNILTEIEIYKKNINIKTESVESIYDGFEHNYDGIEYDNNSLILGDSIIINDSTIVKGSGTYINVLDINILNNNQIDVTNNYNIIYDYGKIKINKKDLNIKTKSKEFIYSGEEFENVEYINSELCINHEIIVDSNTKKINPGTYDNEVLVKINDGNIDVTNNYNIIYNYGTLTINKKDVDINVSSNLIYGENFEEIELSDGYIYDSFNFESDININELGVGHYNKSNSNIIFNIQNEFYNFNVTNYDINIQKRELHIKYNDINKIYDSNNFIIEEKDYEILNLVNNDDVIINFKYLDNGFNKIDNIINCGYYYVYPDLIDNNYYFKSFIIENNNIGLINIIQRDIVIKTNDVSEIYNGEYILGNIESNIGLLDNHQIEIINQTRLKNVYNTINEIKINIFDLNNIDVTSNYNIIYNFGKYVINRREIRLNINPISDHIYNKEAVIDNGYEIEEGYSFIDGDYHEYKILFMQDGVFITPKNVGKYDVFIDNDYDNYDVKYNELSFNVVEAKILISPKEDLVKEIIFDNNIFDIDIEDYEYYLVNNNEKILLDDLYDSYITSFKYDKYDFNDNFISSNEVIRYAGIYHVKTPIIRIIGDGSNNYNFIYDDLKITVLPRNENIEVSFDYNGNDSYYETIFDNTLKAKISDFKVNVRFTDTNTYYTNIRNKINIYSYTPFVDGYVKETSFVDAGIYIIKIESLLDTNNSIDFTNFYEDLEFRFVINKGEYNIKPASIANKEYDGYSNNYPDYFGNYILVDLYENMEFYSYLKLAIIYELDGEIINEPIDANDNPYHYYVDLDNSIIGNKISNNFNINIYYDKDDYNEFYIYKKEINVKPNNYDDKTFDNIPYNSYLDEFNNDYYISDLNLKEELDVLIEIYYLDKEIVVNNPLNSGSYAVRIKNISLKNNSNFKLSNYEFKCIDVLFNIYKINVEFYPIYYYNDKVYDGIEIDEYYDFYGNYQSVISSANSLLPVNLNINDLFKIDICFYDDGHLINGYPKNAGYYEYYVNNVFFNPIHDEEFYNNFNIIISSNYYSVTINKRLLEISYNNNFVNEKDFDNNYLVLNTNQLLNIDNLVSNDLVNFSYYYKNGNIRYEDIKNAGSYDVYIYLNDINYYIDSIYDNQKLFTYKINKRALDIKPISKPDEVYNGKTIYFDSYLDFIYINNSIKPSDLNDSDISVNYKYYLIINNQLIESEIKTAGHYKIYIVSINNPNYEILNSEEAYEYFNVSSIAYDLLINDLSVPYGTSIDDINKSITTKEVKKKNINDLECDELYTFKYEIKDPSNVKHVGSYELELNLIVLYNGIILSEYDEGSASFTPMNLNLEITPKKVIINGKNQSIYFDGYNHSYQYEFNDLEYNDYLLYSDKYELDSINVGLLNVGIYKSVPDINTFIIKDINGNDITSYGDYEFTLKNGLFEIKPIEILVTSSGFIYGNDSLNLNNEYEFILNKNDNKLDVNSGYFTFKINENYPKYKNLSFNIKFSYYGLDSLYKVNYSTKVITYNLTSRILVDNEESNNFIIKNAEFMISQRDITFDFNDVTYEYDSNIKFYDDYTYSNLAFNDYLKFELNDGAYNAGNYESFDINVLKNNFKIYDLDNNEVSNNYNFKANYSTLIINKAKLYVDYKDINIEYTGKIINLNKLYPEYEVVEVSGLIGLDNISEIYLDGHIQYYGDSINNNAQIRILNKNKNDVTDSYEIIPLNTGIISISKLEIDMDIDDLKINYGNSINIKRSLIFSKKILDSYEINTYLNDEIVDISELEVGSYNIIIKISFSNDKITNSYIINDSINANLVIKKAKIGFETSSKYFIYDGNYHYCNDYEFTDLKDKFDVNINDYTKVKELNEYEENIIYFNIYYKNIDVTSNFDIEYDYGYIGVFANYFVEIKDIEYSGNEIILNKDMFYISNTDYIVSYVDYECDEIILNPGKYHIKINDIQFITKDGLIINLDTEQINNGMESILNVVKKEIIIKPSSYVVEEAFVSGKEYSVDPNNYVISDEYSFLGISIISKPIVANYKMTLVFDSKLIEVQFNEEYKDKYIIKFSGAYIIKLI